ncbi:MAG: thioredoxin [Eubacterium sp.]|nr:thioredoxin [Eubacterium sp.]
MKKWYKTIGCILLSAIWIAIGIRNGQNEQVFMKAIKICLECVGLG